MAFTEVAGARLNWRLSGRESGPALVLLNSIGTGMELWAAMLPLVEDRFAVLRLDTRGHGGSTAEPVDFTLPMLARDVLAVADAAGFARFSVAGVSLGGMIGMQLALDAPERVERLALICTSATMDRGAWSDRVAKVRGEGMAAIVDLAMGRFLSEEFRAAQREVAEAVRANLLAMDPAGYAGCAAAIRDMDLASRLGAIAMPTLVVTGTRDTSTPLEAHGEHLLTGIAGAEHVALAAAHLAPLEAPQALAAALLSFLQR
jgi:3-oxoadipate enol-lactonase